MANKLVEWRRNAISKRVLKWYRKMLPPISDTEQAAIDAGTVWWGGEHFSRKPDWQKLRDYPNPVLSEEENAFLDGPTEQLCAMLSDWEIRRAGDLPDNVWSFIRNNGFMGMIIPKERGGLGFSALAHSAVVMKIASRSPTAAVTVMVPNSLGPAELLLRYGTKEQSDYYLPRLAKGDEIPCFALTGPEAGSDAASMPDKGIICYGEHEGARTLGLRVTWDKRYITLAPVATILGLAFRAFDPDHLLGDTEDLGITLALVPTATDGVKIGRRHFPAGQAFQNGPTQGDDVFIPMEWIIGGQERIGQGWRMLMDSLAAGRAISLPALGTGAAIFCARYAGAYARIRRQFGIPIGRFEGVEEPLARIAAYAYALDAARKLTAASLDAGEQPSVISAILKYHSTERMRTALNDALDIHGGRGICDGPSNYLFGLYQSVPVAITVEGANILTRNLMIFGQGAIRCHPHLLNEMTASNLEDPKESLEAFDKELWAHVADATSNIFRAFWHNLTFAVFASTPEVRGIGGMYRRLHAACVTFAAASDLVMGTLGGGLKRREGISARLGDILSELYLMSCVLKRFESDGMPAADLPLVEWNHRMSLYDIQNRLDQVLVDLPNRPVAWLLRIIAFPWGRRRRPPSGRLIHACAELILAASETRERLTAGIYVSEDSSDATGLMEAAFAAALIRDSIEAKLRKAGKTGRAALSDLEALVTEGALSREDADILNHANETVRKAIAVDHFAPEELVERPKQAPGDEA
ncbi:MAG: acyl-CoA dehydrogenase [Micropepsaceae bacterium]